MRRPVVVLALVVGLSALTAPASAEGWRERIDDLVSGKRIGVAVADDGRLLFAHRAAVKRIPASAQKVLLSMAALDRLGETRRFRTTAVIRRGSFGDGVVAGNLWLVGRGDPSLSSGSYGTGFGFEPTRLGDLARAVRRAGVRRIEGAVVGATGYFSRDWWATGWKADFPTRYIPLPTALSIDGNVVDGRHTSAPERTAARRLTRKLRNLGVGVSGRPRAGSPPSSRTPVAAVSSVPLSSLIRHMDHASDNLFAEVLGKALGVARSGPPGTIAAGAAALRAYAAARGVGIEAYDSSGLSYANRVSARGLQRLLTQAGSEPWEAALRSALPRAGTGTLEGRLDGVRVRAKTGTLDEVSALTGWVWLERTGSWAEFAILSSGMTKTRAVRIEDRIVRIVGNHAG